MTNFILIPSPNYPPSHNIVSPDGYYAGLKTLFSDKNQPTSFILLIRLPNSIRVPIPTPQKDGEVWDPNIAHCVERARERRVVSQKVDCVHFKHVGREKRRVTKFFLMNFVIFLNVFLTVQLDFFFTSNLIFLFKN